MWNNPKTVAQSEYDKLLARIAVLEKELAEVRAERDKYRENTETCTLRSADCLQAAARGN